MFGLRCTRQDPSHSDQPTPLMIRQGPILLAVMLTFINDSYFKYSPLRGVITGKMSDFCGLFFFPFFINDLWILGTRNLLCKSFLGSNSAAFIFPFILVVTALGFIGIKFSPAILHLYTSFYQLMGINVRVTKDYTDLLALISLPCASWYFHLLKVKKKNPIQNCNMIIVLIACIVAFPSKSPAATSKPLPQNRHAETPKPPIERSPHMMSSHISMISAMGGDFDKLKETYFKSSYAPGYQWDFRYLYNFISTYLVAGLNYTHSNIQKEYQNTQLKLSLERMSLDLALGYYGKLRHLKPEFFVELGIYSTLYENITLSSGTGIQNYQGSNSIYPAMGVRHKFALSWGGELRIFAPIYDSTNGIGYSLGGTYAL